MSIIRVLKGLFGANASPGTDSYHFDEDSYLMIELIPKENYSVDMRTAEEIKDQAESSVDDLGWTKCYVKNEMDYPTSCKDIPVDEMIDFLLQGGFLQLTNVDRENFYAFKHYSLIVCLESSGKYLKNIWFGSYPEAAHLGLFKRFLLRFSSQYAFLLYDDNHTVVVDITIPDEIDQYFQECLN